MYQFPFMFLGEEIVHNIYSLLNVIVISFTITRKIDEIFPLQYSVDINMCFDFNTDYKECFVNSNISRLFHLYTKPWFRKRCLSSEKPCGCYYYNSLDLFAKLAKWCNLILKKKYFMKVTAMSNLQRCQREILSVISNL